MTSLREAVRRGDLPWLSAHLDVADCVPAVVKLLVRQDDPRLRHLGLERLGARIARPGVTESELAALAGLLPRTLDGPPETALLLARLHHELRRYVPERALPQWRTAGLPARVRIAWLRAELLHEPGTVHREPAGELLYQALDGITAADPARPEELVRELAATGDPVLRHAALRLTRDALHAGLLAPARARAHIAGLLDTPHTAVDALRELAEPWAAFAPFPGERLRQLLSAPSPAAIDAALAVAARHGHGDLMRDLVTDDTAPPRTRQEALRALGEVAGRDDIRRITALAATDPLLYGEATLDCLRAMHRRGLFPGDDDAAAVVSLALADHRMSADETATILFTCRHPAFRALVDTDADDPTWPRRLALLVGLARQGGGDVPAGDAVTAVLAATARPEPFLDAIRALRHRPAETAVLDALPRAPEAALHALEAIGGPPTVAVLMDGLGLDAHGPQRDAGTVIVAGGHHRDPARCHDHGPAVAAVPIDGRIAPHLRTVRHRALELLWHLTDDPGQRRLILDRLDPRDVPARIVTDLGAPDRRELALLTAGLDPGEPVRALVALARNGDATTLPSIADVLLRIVAELAASSAPQVSRDAPPADEPAVPDEVLTAIRALGGRLHGRGTLRPFCLREAGDADEAGRALVATLTLDLLDRPGLTAGEQAVLLDLLRRVPYPGTRARVHRLLRHRDRHVRKQVIAVLAAGTPGDDAEALSASLIALTAARDPQTVRAALLALGHLRARWAARAIAACLGHPTMNVKKTAAAVLVHAGTPAVVPELLSWLGRHDNPGLRTALAEALRAILGEAYAATVLAAAEQDGDDRTRYPLLTALDSTLSARAVGALAEQGSPVAPALLTLIATGRVRLGSGTVEELAALLAAHGLTAPGRPDPAGDDQADHDVEALTRDGWDPATARRIADRPDPLSAAHRDRLRPLLADWLRLAGSAPGTLRFVLRLCPAPWTAEEITVFARAAHTLADGLADAAGADRDALLAVLEAAAPALDGRAFDVVCRIRALPPAPAGRRSTLPLLRSCGAVLRRADVEQALAAARLGPDPWRAEAAVLREAFTPGTALPQDRITAGIPVSRDVLAAVTGPAGASAGPTGARLTGGAVGRAPEPVATATADWRAVLEAAVRTRTPDAVAALRASDDRAVPSPDRLSALIDAFPAAGPDVRAALLDWMESLQPIDAPRWTLGEDAHRPAPVARIPHDGDLDQPRSAAQRARLLAMLGAPEARRRDAAAAALRDWPEPDIARAVLHAFLHGKAEVAITAGLARALTELDDTALRDGARDSGDAFRERVARVAAHLDGHRLYPLLLDWWEHGGPAVRAAVEHALRRDSRQADALAECLRGRLEAGGWGFLDLIAGRPLLRTPALTETCRRLRAEGRDDLADRLVLIDGPLRPRAAADAAASDATASDATAGNATAGNATAGDATAGDAATLAALRERPRPPAEATGGGPSRDALIDLVRTGGTTQIKRALTRLAEAGEAEQPDFELEDLLAELLRHPEAKVRLHAHRVGRVLLDRATHLRHTAMLLDDPEPAIIRSAIATLSHAGYRPAIPAVIGLLPHPHTAVRRAAADGLVRLGSPAVPALTYAAGHARPDRRHHYTTVLDRITDRDEQR